MAAGLYDITPLEPLIEEGYVLLTPNDRLARRIRAEWDARHIAAGDRVWEPLAVQPLESWLLEQWQRVVSLDLLPPVAVLRPAQIRELWRQVIVAQQNQSTDFHLLRPAAAAEHASQARDSLWRWQVDMGSPGIRQSFELDPDCGTFARWLALFEERLAEAGQCTLVDCLAQLPGLAGRLPAARVVLVEFEEIAPLLRSALAALSEEVREVHPDKPPAERLVHAFGDNRAQLQTVATWAATVHRVNPAVTIGIVLSNMATDRVSLEYLLRREFDCLGENYNSLPVNFSTGIPLAQAPIVRDALAVLSMGLQYTTVPAVVALLRSRFLTLPGAQSVLSQYFVTQLYKEGREQLSLGDLRNAAIRVTLGEEKGLELGRHLLKLSMMRELRADALPSTWVARFMDVLSVWGWPGNQALDSLEYQQMDLWYRTLDEFRGFDGICGVIGFGAALQLLRDSCAQQISQPQTADNPVQVLGPLEAAGLAFDHLWLCSMQGASWPASPRPNPFIPVSLQSRLQMPHASHQREWAFSESLLRQYARSCQVIHASYCYQLDGVPDLPSALLHDFNPQAMPAPPGVSKQWSDSFRCAVHEQVPDNRGPRLEPQQQATMKGGSGLLEHQSQCAFRAFAQHRMLIEPLNDFSIALSSAERGSLLHEALFVLWGEIGDHQSLLALDSSCEQETVVRAVEAAIEGIPEQHRRKLGAAFWQLEAQRMNALLHEWLAVERQRGTFSVVQREQDITLELAQLQIRLRVDRIDELPDGSRVIIDYKSGKSKVQDWLGDRPARPQLLLYGIAEPDGAAALAFAQVRTRDCRYVGLGRVDAAPGISSDFFPAVKAGMDAQDWASLNDCWRNNLERLAQAFVEGDARVNPLTPSGCNWCGLQPLCRIDTTEKIADAQAQ